jgi:non-homologous end joining protein Ku
MPRSIWNGTITFGLVNIPVKLYSATESKTVHFPEVHARDGAKIEHRRICPKGDKEVPAPASDLMEALKRSLDNVRAGRDPRAEAEPAARS